MWGQDDGAQAGQRLLSMIGSGDASDAGGANDSNNVQQDVPVECRPMQPWLPAANRNCDDDIADQSTGCSSMLSPVNLNVVLEDMSDLQAPWDQFEVNEKQYGVKTSFNIDLSQYTTKLELSKIPSDVRHEAARIAAEIEQDHKANTYFDGDGNTCTDIADVDNDEEAKFSAVCRQKVQMQ